MEKRTRHGGREEKEIENWEGEKETDRCREGETRRRAALLFISRRKTKNQRDKHTEK